MIKYELYKVFTRKLFWVTLAAALIINALALWWLNPPPSGMSHGDVKKVYDAIRPLPFEEKLDFLSEFTSINLEPEWMPGFDYSLWDETAMLQRSARRDLADAIAFDLTVNTYAAYLDRIDQEADLLLGSAIFGSDPDSFSSRNIAKTQQDFADMRGVVTNYDVNTGIAVLFDSPSADIIIILLIIVICIALITDEKDKRLFLLVKSTPNGYIHTIMSKLGTTSICVIGVSGLVFLSTLVFAEITYGLGNMQRAIQSVPEFMPGTLNISVAGFIILCFIAKTAGFLCIAMLILLIAIHAKHSIIMISTTALLAIGNALLAAIPLNSGWNALRFLNLFTLIRPHRVYGAYLNLNIFGHPVRLMPVFIAFTAVAFLALLYTVCLSFVKKRGLETTHDLFKFKKLRVFAFLSQPHTSWKYFEFKKLAFVNKALLILIAFVIIQGISVYSAEKPLFGLEHDYVKNALLLLQGELTDEKEAVILAEKARFDYAQAEVDRLTESFINGEIDLSELLSEISIHNETMQIMQGFLTLYERYEYVRDNENAQFLYDAGYAELFGLRDPDSGLDAGMRLITVLLLCLCGVFPIEYKTGMYKVLGSAIHGHSDTVRLKLLLSVSLTAVAFIMASLPELIYIGRNFGFAGVALPLASIQPTQTGQIPVFMGSFPVWSYIVLLHMLRFTVFTAVAMVILALSLKIGSSTYTALAGAGIMLLPLFLHLFGFDLLNAVSLLDLVTVNGIIVAPGILKTIQAVVLAGICAVSVQYVRRWYGVTL